MGRAKDPLIEPNWWELPAILALTAVLTAAEIGDWRAEDTLNVVAPVWLSLALGVSALKMGTADSRAIWTPLFWFRVATLIYFGVGNIAPMIMNSASLIYAQSAYFFLPEDVQRVNLIAAFGVACVLSGNLIYERLFVPARASGVARRAPRAPDEAARKGVALLLIGVGINYFHLGAQRYGLDRFRGSRIHSEFGDVRTCGLRAVGDLGIRHFRGRRLGRRGVGGRRELGRRAHAQQELGALALDRLRDRRAQLQPYHSQIGDRRVY